MEESYNQTTQIIVVDPNDILFSDLLNIDLGKEGIVLTETENEFYKFKLEEGHRGVIFRDLKNRTFDWYYRTKILMLNGVIYISKNLDKHLMGYFSNCVIEDLETINKKYKDYAKKQTKH